MIRTVQHPSLPARAHLAARTLYWFAYVHLNLRRRQLPDLVVRLRAVGRVRPYRVPAGRLGRGVARLLTVGPFEARCLVKALVHLRLLREQGDDPDLVIGLEPAPRTHDAHAWLEIGGRDVGPPPGRGTHQELVRYR